MNLPELYYEKFQGRAVIAARAPGRVNLLGEHVDYNDGIVLPAAIDRSVSIAAGAREDRVVNLYAVDFEEEASFSLEGLQDRQGLDGKELPAWALYPAGVAWALQESGYEVKGMQAVFSSDVPIGSGLSSSAAVEVGFAFAWQALGGWQTGRMTLARICQTAENSYVGVSSGLMDQFASAHGVKGHALYFDTRSLEWEPVALPGGTALVIADSGVRRTLSGSAYNDRRAACEEAVRILRRYKPEIKALRDISPPEFAAYSMFLPEVVQKRAEHVVKEIHRVETAATALKLGEARSFGRMMFAGHASLRDLYEVSTVELDALVDIARRLPGCLGARLTGAGFGGCTVNLVEEEQVEAFAAGLEGAYRERMKRGAQVYVCQASDGASVNKLK